MIEDQDVAFGFNDVGKVDIRVVACLKENSLMVDLRFLIIKHRARNGFNQDFGDSGKLDDFVNARILAHPLGNPEARCRTAGCTQ